jgi:hypothetical protein
MVVELITCAVLATVLILGAGVLVWNWVEALLISDDEE